MRQFAALIHKDADSGYGVSFPDVPGCVTAGVTLDEARVRAEEVLAFHVHGMIEDGDPLPEPSSLEAVMANRENRDGVAIPTDLGEDTGEAIRVDVTLPRDVLERIDRHASARGMDRSGFLTHAAKRAPEDV